MAKPEQERRIGEDLIGGTFAAVLDRPQPQTGGGLAAFAVRDAQGPRRELTAIQVRRGLLPRAQALGVLPGAGIAGLMLPLAHGAAAGPDGSAGYFVICRAPPGPPLGTEAAVARRWSEAELLACVLRPAAACLAELQARRITHRAIRPNNVFQAGPGQPVTLGAAWAAPPASLQPAAFEPPYSAMCLPAGRGEGGVADDVYALGVLLLALAGGGLPLAGIDDAEIVRRKLALGSFAALVDGGLDPRSVPATIVELARGMLAEDPDHRPTPSQLGNPDSARARRLAARPPRQAQRPLVVAGHAVWTARALAGELAAAPEAAPQLLRGGSVDAWLRRGLADPTLTAQVEEAVRARAADADGAAEPADAMLVARAVAALDPLAPLCWRGVAIWPDGVGPALAAADASALDRLGQAVAVEALAIWAGARPERCDPALLGIQARQYRAVLQRRGWSGGIAALRYALNPLAHCASPLLERCLVTRLSELLPALEAASARAEARPPLPLDAEIAAFIAARDELRMDRDLAAAADPAASAGAGAGSAAAAQLRVLARLQSRLQAAPLLGLAAWLAAGLRPAFDAWQGRSRRAQLLAALDERAALGHLPAILDLIDDPGLRAQDAQEADAAREEVARIDAALRGLGAERARRAASARHAGQEVASALGVIAASAMALWLAL